MKKFFCGAAVFLLFACLAGGAQARLPRNFQTFRDEYKRVAKTPEGAARMFFDAVYAYLEEDLNEEASNMVALCLREKPGWEKRATYSYFAERLYDRPYIFRSYAKGTSPKNNYAMNPENYTLNIVEVKDDPAYVGAKRVSIRSSGADSLRPLILRNYNGYWFVSNCCAIYSDVRFPQSTQKGDEFLDGDVYDQTSSTNSSTGKGKPAQKHNSQGGDNAFDFSADGSGTPEEKSDADKGASSDGAFDMSSRGN